MTDTIILEQRAARYPRRLRHLDNPPRVLYARGRLELLDRVTLGVVGSRDCTDYGIDVTRTLVRSAAQAGAVIISGLARGIDTVAHTTALEAGGSTVAVLGCGIDICYPKSNLRLFERIAAEGLLLSEFEPGTPPFARNFPHRNRIIAMLSRSLLVTEAADHSGTKHTADAAAHFMDVLAVPGPIGRETSVGTNKLIQDGAIVVLCPEDVLDSLRLERPTPVSSHTVGVSADARTVWRTLSGEARHIDDIAARSRLPAGAVTLALLELELSGYAAQLPGSRYALPKAAL